MPGMDGQKMSKSYGNTIEIFGDEKAMRKKIMGIAMDSAARLPNPSPTPKKISPFNCSNSSRRRNVAKDFEEKLARRRPWLRRFEKSVV